MQQVINVPSAKIPVTKAVAKTADIADGVTMIRQDMCVPSVEIPVTKAVAKTADIADGVTMIRQNTMRIIITD